MDCPDCGRPMLILDQTVTGDDIFHVIETEWYCLYCEFENETEYTTTGKGDWNE